MGVERTGGLTCAQREWFRDLGADADSDWSFEANFHAVVPGHRVPVGDAVVAVRDLLDRHEGLRSTIEPLPTGERRQHVHAPDDGLAEVVRIVAEDEADDALTAAGRTSFKLAAQWPVLFVLVLRDGAVARIGIVVDHAAVDGWGMRVLCQDLGQALRARTCGEHAYGAALPPEQPLDSVRREEGEEGERYQRRALRHWRRELESLGEALGGWTPADAVVPPVQPELHSCRLATAHAARAAEAIAAARNVPVSTVYLAALGSALRAVERAPAAAISMLSANRVSPGVQASVRKAVMPAPVVLAAGESFAEELARCSARQLQAHRFADLRPETAADLQESLLGPLRHHAVAATRFNYIDNSLVGSGANSRSWGADGIPFTDPAHQDVIGFGAPRPGGSRHILSVQHRPTVVLFSLAWHADTGWDDHAAPLLRQVESLLTTTAAELGGR